MIRKILSILLLGLALPAAAQSTPNANYTDMWWNAAESGWGVSIMQHTGTNQVYAVWYTYDPRETDAATGQFKPLWLVMAGGNWTSPTTLTGPVYVTNGRPFNQSGSNTTVTNVGSFTFSFSSTQAGTFTYNIAPPTNVASTDPAFSLPALTGSKSITRQGF
jgi:hypothetical protein